MSAKRVTAGDFLNAQDVADLLGVSRWIVYRDVKEKKIPGAIWLGQFCLRFHKDIILDWLKRTGGDKRLRIKNDTESYIDSRTAANMLHVSVTTLYFYSRKGKVPGFIRLSARCTRYDKKILTDWIKNGGGLCV